MTFVLINILNSAINYTYFSPITFGVEKNMKDQSF